MFEVFKFECRYQLRSPLFVVLATVFFLLAFLIMASESVSLGGVGNNLNLNASWVIVYTQFFFSIIGMLAAIAIVSQAITRDYELQTAELFFATGIAPSSFLFGRFLGGTLFGIFVGVAALAGTLVASLMPWLDHERVGDFTILPFVYALLVVTVPNLFFSCALFFSIAALTRSMLAAFIGAVGFLVAYIVISSLSDPELIQVYALLDPFGGTAFGEVSRYWTVFERNTMLVPVEGALLWNRLIWVGVGLISLTLTAWRYGFNLNPSVFRRRRKTETTQSPPIRPMPVVDKNYTASTYWAQFVSQLKIDLSAIYKSVPFYAILGFAALNVWGAFQGVTSGFGTPVLPTTGALLRAVEGSYLFFILLIILYFAGEIVHRERQANVSDVLDATPFPDFVMVMSKLVCLWSIVTALLLFALVSAVVVQTMGNYTNFEWSLYINALFFVQGGFFYLLAVLAIFVQIAAGNKWLGMIAMLLVFLVFQTLPSLGFEHGLYNFGTPNVVHSDMNGYGHYWAPLVAYTIYWTCFCVLLVVLSNLLFTRGRAAGWKDRTQIAASRLSGGMITLSTLGLLAFVTTGGWIYYQSNVLNEYRLQDDAEALQADYEKNYKQYELMPLPEVVAVDAVVDLYPSERRLESRGSARLTNHTGQALKEIFLSTHPLAKVNILAVDGGEPAEQNAQQGAYFFDLPETLRPGASTAITWDISWDHHGYNNSNESAITGGANNRVIENGTFVNNTEIMPNLGYNSGAELGDPNTRRDYDLPPIVRLPKLGDPQWINRSQLGLSRRTDFRVEFSTHEDQIAIAPGYLVGEVEQVGDRKTYKYEMDEAIWPFFSFVSADYEVLKDKWNDVAIEIYYDKKHAYNIGSMVEGTKKSLDYFSKEFTPYQYRQFRILEFPRYASFAQSFPNTIPYSEAIGFVADLREEEHVDLVFYVTAHELAHQWWGHQVAGAQMQGMTVIVETLAQYSALMVMEREYGKDRMRRFLRSELDRYLLNRGGELIEELPLALNENQGYIHYQKGSLVMYALQDTIGEEEVNHALRRFLAKYAYGTGPFPTSMDLVEEFRKVAGLEHQDLITDLFEKITLYDFAVESVDAVLVEGKHDQWELTFKTKSQKYYANGEGEQTDASLSAWVDIAVFPASEEELEEFQLPKPLFFERRLVTTGEMEFSVVVNQLPDKVGIDPYNKMIDRNPQDNLKSVNL